ncbi:MAG: hypothetical protein KTR14_01195 [Vampirovibrio sp.]|nr:hypothetical protein [Vampirovibrio sp.]
MLRAAIGVILVLLMLVIGVALYAYFSRLSIVEALIRDNLEKLGFTQIELNVDRIETDGVILSNLTLSKDGHAPVTAGKIEVLWDWQEIRQGKVEAISLKNAVLPLEFDGNSWRISGVPLDNLMGSSQGSAPRLPIIKADRAELRVKTPEGSGELELTGSYDPTRGGEFSVQGQTEGIQLGDATIRNAQADLMVDLKSDGTFSGKAVSVASLSIGRT